MSSPSLLISRDDLRDQEYFNYSAIDQYWQDKGMTEDSLRILYKIGITTAVVIFIGLLCLYYATYLTRKKMSLAKHLGVEQRTGWETFCQNFELGQSPTINFVSSCLITNDRVFIVMRLILAVWSLTVTLFTFAGARSIILGLYYPLAMIITVHINRKRHLIVEGFGSKMSFLNKLCEWLFFLQIPWQLFMSVVWWTQWFGTCRYRDMVKPFNRPRAVLFQEEFCPFLFFLTEMIWFDTNFDLSSCLHALCFISGVILQFMWNAFKKNGGTANPQLTSHAKENPAAAIWQLFMNLFLYPGFCIPVAVFSRTKIWIFTKIPVMRERLQIRTECIEIFRKRRALNKFLPKETVEERKSVGRSSYSSIGRKSMNRDQKMETAMRNTYSRSRR